MLLERSGTHLREGSVAPRAYYGEGQDVSQDVWRGNICPGATLSLKKRQWLQAFLHLMTKYWRERHEVYSGLAVASVWFEYCSRSLAIVYVRVNANAN